MLSMCSNAYANEFDLFISQETHVSEHHVVKLRYILYNALYNFNLSIIKTVAQVGKACYNMKSFSLYRKENTGHKKFVWLRPTFSGLS